MEKFKRKPYQTNLTIADKIALHQLSDLKWKYPCHLINCRDCPFFQKEDDIEIEYANSSWCLLQELHDTIFFIMSAFDM